MHFKWPKADDVSMIESQQSLWPFLIGRWYLREYSSSIIDEENICVLIGAYSSIIFVHLWRRLNFVLNWPIFTEVDFYRKQGFRRQQDCWHRRKITLLTSFNVVPQNLKHTPNLKDLERASRVILGARSVSFWNKCSDDTVPDEITPFSRRNPCLWKVWSR